HQDVAVCCAPNAGRIYPYYVKSMWLRKEDGILAALYGPNILETEINGVKVRIEQVTSYPFNHKVRFIIEPEEPVQFDLAFRKPKWATSVHLEGKSVPESEIREGTLSLNREWKKGDIVELSFNADVEVKQDNKGDSYFAYGPLAFAVPIEAEEKIYKEYGNTNFIDSFYEPLNSEGVPYEIPVNTQGELVKGTYSHADPW